MFLKIILEFKSDIFKPFDENRTLLFNFYHICTLLSCNTFVTIEFSSPVYKRKYVPLIRSWRSSVRVLQQYIKAKLEFSVCGNTVHKPQTIGLTPPFLC